jgi:hypothetical protein
LLQFSVRPRGDDYRLFGISIVAHRVYRYSVYAYTRASVNMTEQRFILLCEEA